MSKSRKAIFLSYASQDAGAAKRIGESLRAAGLEVWFDQSELRGGDAWDGSIRRQIKECALFVPIISANTDARSEGYFRLEGKLAVDRSHLMADDQTFLLPVVIDETPEASARVPDVFRARQWTHLSGALPTSKFVDRVKRLLGAQRDPATGGEPDVGTPVAPRLVARPSFPKGLVAGIGATALGLVVFFAYHSFTKDPAVVAGNTSVTRLDVAPDVASPDPNSVAVLPFANLSDDK